MPTERPLMIRPTISMPMFWEAQIRVEPITLILVRFNGRRIGPFSWSVWDSPDDAADHNGRLPPKTIGEDTGNQSTQPRTTSHRGRNTTLNERSGTTAVLVVIKRRSFRALVEVTFV